MHAGEGADDKPGNMRKMPEAHLFMSEPATVPTSELSTRPTASARQLAHVSCRRPLTGA